MYALSPFLSKILDNADIEIHLVHDLSRKITEQVITSEIDIGIVVNPVRHPDLVIQKLYDDEVAFWSLAPSIREDSDCIETLIYDPNLIQIQSLLKKVEKVGLRKFRPLETANLEVVASLTASGCGVGILPERVAKLAHKKLHRLPGSPVFKDEICLITRIESKKVASIQYICSTIKSLSKDK
jgi:DNA-binding transcriptional LysR family regulator